MQGERKMPLVEVVLGELRRLCPAIGVRLAREADSSWSCRPRPEQ